MKNSTKKLIKDSLIEGMELTTIAVGGVGVATLWKRYPYKNDVLRTVDCALGVACLAVTAVRVCRSIRKKSVEYADMYVKEYSDQVNYYFEKMNLEQ